MSDLVQQFLRFLAQGDIQKAFRLDHISPQERQHLHSVYAAVLIGLLIGAGGCGAGGVIFHVGLFSPATLSLLATLLSVFFMYRLRATTLWTSPTTQKGISVESGAYYSLSAFSTGLSLSGIVLYTAAISLQLLVSAVMMSAAIFACLSLASLFAQRRSFLFLASTISAIAFYTTLASIFGLFFPSNALDTLVTIGGLVTGIGYVLEHTQVILEHARYGGNGPLMDAMTLYMDFIHLFVNILRVLLQRRGDDTEDTRHRSGRTRKSK